MRQDTALFRSAYPASPQQFREAQSALKKLPADEVDVRFSWDLCRWLTERFPGTASIDWDDWDDEDRLASVLTPLIPELRERIVDANVPYLDYAKARDLKWWVDNLTRVTFDLLGLWILWKVPADFSMQREPVELFFDKNIIPRREVTFDGPPLAIRKLTDGQEAIDQARAILAVRYRELYVPTFGDPLNVISAYAGRGLEIVLLAIRPDKRLPVRTGYAPFFFRNGIPVGYGDLYLHDGRAQVSFNIFPAFRKGESAWIFARLLQLYRQLFSPNDFTIDPYQIGLGNEEAIESGAFWFYRKLGFRPSDPKIERLARTEERRKRRSSLATLRRLAASEMVYRP